MLRFDLLKEAQKHVNQHWWILAPARSGFYKSDISTPRQFHPTRVNRHNEEVNAFMQSRQILNTEDRDEKRYKLIPPHDPSNNSIKSEIFVKRDFVAGYGVRDDINSRIRFSKGLNAWINCIEFIYMVFRRIGALSQKDLEYISSTKELFDIRLGQQIISLRTLHHPDPRPGDIVIWYRENVLDLKDLEDEFGNEMPLYDKFGNKLSLEVQMAQEAQYDSLLTHIGIISLGTIRTISSIQKEPFVISLDSTSWAEDSIVSEEAIQTYRRNEPKIYINPEDFIRVLKKACLSHF